MTQKKARRSGGLDGVESEPCHDDATEPAATIRDRRADRQPGTALPDRARLDVWMGHGPVATEDLPEPLTV